MTNKEIVSVGVPVHNASKFIERCASSIFTQNYENLDIVFVDDCSTDNSMDIIRATLERFPHRKNHTRIISLTTNQGVSVARNTLIEAFKGDFFTFVDADDYLSDNAIDLLVCKQKEDESDLVTGNIKVKYFDKEDIIEEPYFNYPDEMLLHLVSQPANHSNWARLYRKSIVIDNDIRYKSGMSMGEDWLFLVNVVMNLQSVSKIKDFIYTYDCTNEDSAMHRLANSQVFAKYMLLELENFHEIYGLIKNRGKKYTDSLEKMMAKRVEDGLIAAYRAKDRKSFDSIKHYIPQLSSNNIERNYHFRKLYLFGNIVPEYYSLYFMAKGIIKRLRGVLQK